MQLPPEIKVETKSERNKNPLIILESCDKTTAGSGLFKIRSFRKPEPIKVKVLSLLAKKFVESLVSQPVLNNS